MSHVSGPQQSDAHSATFIDTSGRPVLIAREAVLSAKPNEQSLNDAGEPAVVMVWLKGHNRFATLRSTWQEFEDWRFSG